MALLIIILLLVVFTAWRDKRPLKLVLSEEEAKAVKARWWAAARGELKAWAICCGIGFALLAEPLAAAHWRPAVYVAIAYVTLLLFSRLAIRVTLGISVLAYGVDALATILGHPLCQPIVVMAPIAAVVVAIMIRALLFLFSLVPPLPRIVDRQVPPRLKAPEEPEYDFQTDTYLYKEGNREPAFIRFPRYEDRPENRRS